MGGWSIDHILAMPITRYTAVREAILHLGEINKNNHPEVVPKNNTFR